MRDLLLRARVAILGPLLRRAVRCPPVARGISRAPRRLQPGGRWVTRHDLVVEALRRDRDFGMPYLTRMEQLGARFVLGLNPSTAYARQVDALGSALDGVDDAQLAARTRDDAELAMASAAGSVDLIALTDGVLARTAAAVLWSGDALTGGQLADARAISRDIFINPLGDPAVMRRAERAVPALRSVLRTIVEERRRAGADPGGDVLDRLLAADGAAFRGDEVLDTLLGTLVAWVTSVSRTMGYGMDELLRPEHRDALARAQEAARRGSAREVGDVLLEALRFRPSMPALERVCTRQSTLDGRTIERGEKLLLVLTTAMLDERGVPGPKVFHTGRPADAYLHFGRGTHACLGRTIARIQLQEIAAALLRRPDVRRDGALEMDGPFPRRLPVAFG